MPRTTATAKIDIDLVKKLVMENPDEFRGLLGEAPEPMLQDRYGRTVAVKDKVTTPAGESGMVIRIDKKSKRILIHLDEPKDGKTTRMLMAHRVEVRRGRPRKMRVA